MHELNYSDNDKIKSRNWEQGYGCPEAFPGPNFTCFFCTVFARLNAPALILNLASWTRRLFDTGSLFELFIHAEEMAFLL